MKISNKPVAIIPARGESKRIPRKNIIDFDGMPLIAWTIKAALESGLFDKVIVSTDNEDIANVSIKYGAEVPFLRNLKADDHTPVSEATIYTLKQIEETGTQYSEVIQLFATCPLRTHHDILLAYKSFKELDAEFVLSAYRFIWMNPWWAFSMNTRNQANWIFDGTNKKRSQDMETLFGPSGAIWIAKTNALKRDGTFYGDNHTFWEIDWKHAVDIDTYDDLEMAAIIKKGTGG